MGSILAFALRAVSCLKALNSVTHSLTARPGEAAVKFVISYLLMHLPSVPVLGQNPSFCFWSSKSSFRLNTALQDYKLSKISSCYNNAYILEVIF